MTALRHCLSSRLMAAPLEVGNSDGTDCCSLPRLVKLLTCFVSAAPMPDATTGGRQSQHAVAAPDRVRNPYRFEDTPLLKAEPHIKTGLHFTYHGK